MCLLSEHSSAKKEFMENELNPVIRIPIVIKSLNPQPKRKEQCIVTKLLIKRTQALLLNYAKLNHLATTRSNQTIKSEDKSETKQESRLECKKYSFDTIVFPKKKRRTFKHQHTATSANANKLKLRASRLAPSS
eukprot:TRINITY_DN513_c0_g1_i24.p1 TRINITY_DN513_c0_g1~~TRINITY_DN513_c0_g1_i24.p1  ORF type:complete len:134 (-),score=18.62 TRINITY_DN513_c0_g1_i24:107-508(-)